VGWLKDPEHKAPRIDAHDAFRTAINPHANVPGTSVRKKLRLGKQWSDTGTMMNSEGVVVFAREQWSDEDIQDHGRRRYSETPISKGERLTITKRHLKEFLAIEGMDLVVHVEHSKANRGYGYGESGRKEKSCIYNKHFVLRSDGTYEDAIGNSGTWYDNC
jgi:hypothetical protein